jgi:hypothetical protein
MTSRARSKVRTGLRESLYVILITENVSQESIPRQQRDSEDCGQTNSVT